MGSTHNHKQAQSRVGFTHNHKHAKSWLGFTHNHKKAQSWVGLRNEAASNLAEGSISVSALLCVSSLSASLTQLFHHKFSNTWGFLQLGASLFEC